jgi:hypothetical protein
MSQDKRSGAVTGVAAHALSLIMACPSRPDPVERDLARIVVSGGRHWSLGDGCRPWVGRMVGAARQGGLEVATDVERLQVHRP